MTGQAGLVSRSSIRRRGAEWLTAGEERLISLMLAAIVPVLIFAGVKEFSSWSQVDLFWAYRTPPDLLVNHPHYFRYLVVYPGFLLTDYYENAFSLYVASFMLLGQCLMRVMILPTGRIAAIGAQAVYIAAHLFMNGRGGIAWAAWVLAIYAINDGKLYGWRIRHGVMMALAILGSSVSSGAILVTYISTAAIFFNCVFLKGERKGVIYLLPGLMYFLNYLLVSIDKNVAFYHEGNTDAIINMLNHGWGALVEQSMLFIFAMVAAAIVMPFVIYYYMTRYSFSKIVILFSPVAGGAFGFTTLTLAVPSLLVTFLDRRGQRPGGI